MYETAESEAKATVKKLRVCILGVSKTDNFVRFVVRAKKTQFPVDFPRDWTRLLC